MKDKFTLKELKSINACYTHMEKKSGWGPELTKATQQVKEFLNGDYSNQTKTGQTKNQERWQIIHDIIKESKDDDQTVELAKKILIKIFDIIPLHSILANIPDNNHKLASVSLPLLVEIRLPTHRQDINILVRLINEYYSFEEKDKHDTLLKKAIELYKFGRSRFLKENLDGVNFDSFHNKVIDAIVEHLDHKNVKLSSSGILKILRRLDTEEKDVWLQSARNRTLPRYTKLIEESALSELACYLIEFRTSFYTRPIMEHFKEHFKTEGFRELGNPFPREFLKAAKENIEFAELIFKEMTEQEKRETLLAHESLIHKVLNDGSEVIPSSTLKALYSLPRIENHNDVAAVLCYSTRKAVTAEMWIDLFKKCNAATKQKVVDTFKNSKKTNINELNKIFLTKLYVYGKSFFSNGKELYELCNEFPPFAIYILSTETQLKDLISKEFFNKLRTLIEKSKPDVVVDVKPSSPSVSTPASSESKGCSPVIPADLKSDKDTGSVNESKSSEDKSSSPSASTSVSSVISTDLKPRKDSSVDTPLLESKSVFPVATNLFASYPFPPLVAFRVSEFNVLNGSWSSDCFTIIAPPPIPVSYDLVVLPSSENQAYWSTHLPGHWGPQEFRIDKVESTQPLYAYTIIPGYTSSEGAFFYTVGLSKPLYGTTTLAKIFSPAPTVVYALYSLPNLYRITPEQTTKLQQPPKIPVWRPEDFVILSCPTQHSTLSILGKPVLTDSLHFADPSNIPLSSDDSRRPPPTNPHLSKPLARSKNTIWQDKRRKRRASDSELSSIAHPRK